MTNTYKQKTKSIPYILAFLFLALTNNIISAQVASDTVGCVPLLVKFKSPDANLDQPLWDFGDGASSNKLNPSHVYVLPGKYTAKLTNKGVSIAKTIITIYNEVEVNIAYDPQIGCAPLSIQFKNTSKVDTGINIVSYLWDFGDGNSANVANPLYTYTSTGNFSPTLNIKTDIAQCDASKSFEEAISITENLNISFAIDSIVPKCDVPAKVYVRPIGQLDTSYNYKWTFGNDSMTTLLYPVFANYVKQGQYTITLSIDNKKGCKSSISRTITVGSNFGNYKIQAPSTYCLNTEVPVTCSSIFTKYEWTFDSTASIQTSALRSPVELKYKTTGIHIIKLRVYNNQGCFSDTTFQINIEKLKNEIEFHPQVVCGNMDTIMLSAKDKNFTLYRWNGETGGTEYKYIIKDVERDSFFYNYPDSVTIKLESFLTGNCSTESFAKIKILKPNAQFAISGFQGFAPYTVHIQDLSESPCPIVSWIFTWGDGTTTTYDSITIKTASHTYDKKGKYYINLKIINEKGCEDPYYGAWIKVGKRPEANPNGMCKLSSGKNGYNFCFGDTVTIIGNLLSEDITGIRYNLDNTIGHCETEQVITHVLNDTPGKFVFGVTQEGSGVFDDRNLININVYGAKAIMDYKVMCNDKHTVHFGDKSIDATRTFWVIDGDTIREKKFDIDFTVGKHAVQLCAANDEVECRLHCVVDTIDIKNVKAAIETNAQWCSNTDNLLSASNSKDVQATCTSGYTWKFPSSSKEPPILTADDSTYAKLPPGKQEIMLIVKDINGCKDTAYTSVKVYDLHANFKADIPKLCVPIKGNFMDISTSDTTLVQYTWNFNPNLNKPNVDHVFDSLPKDDSTAIIILKVKDALGCEDSHSQIFKIYKPITTVTYPTRVCEVNELIFSATDFTNEGSSLNYKWELDGKIVGETKICKLKNIPAGDYKIHLTIEEKSTGCTNDEYFYSFTTIKKPQAIIAELADSIFCFPESIVFVGDSSKYDKLDSPTFIWNFGNNRSSFKRNPIETFGKGNFNIRLMVYSAYQCGDTASMDIKLIGPEGKLKADKDTICLNENITYTLYDKIDVSNFYWDFGQGETKEGINPASYKYEFLPPSGKTYASLVLESAETGCETVVTVPINFHKTEARFSGDSTCENELTLTNLSVGADLYEWYQDKKLISKADSMIFRPSSIGEYNIALVVKNENNLCIDTFSRQLLFLEKPIINITDQLLCGDQSFTIPIDNKIASYQYFPSGIVEIKGNDYVITPNGVEQLRIKLNGKNGCVAEKEIDIAYRPAFNIDTTMLVAICPSGSTTVPLNLSNADSVKWTFNGNDASALLDCTQCPNPMIKDADPGTLTADFSNYTTCKVERYTFDLRSVNAQVPNVFSPNNDDNNDEFKAIVADKDLGGLMKIKELKIFNRWGKEIYNSNLPWNGNINGEPASEDVYYYLITYTLQDNCDIYYKGDFTLIR